MKPIYKNGIAGYENCPKFLKDAYLRAIKECQQCHKVKPLEPHRLTHRLMHANEFPHVSHSY